MGKKEISDWKKTSEGTSRKNEKRKSEYFLPLESSMGIKGLNNGSCVNREVHAQFCEGLVGSSTGLLVPSNVPTNNLYLKFTFDFTNAANQVIRELGVMVGTKVKEELPIGQRYFEPQDIEDPGILLVLEHTVPLIRTSATRETFSFVVTF